MKPVPGIYENVPFEEYLGWDAVNQSSLPAVLRSPAHYRYAQDNPPEKDRDCFRFGTFAHAGKLEPLSALNSYVVMPDFAEQVLQSRPEVKSPRATKEYKDLVEEFTRVNSDKQVVPKEWYDQLCGICAALSQSQRALEYLACDGPSEVSIVWLDEATDVLCKARIDKWDRDRCRINDLKTTQDAADFDAAVWKWNYHLQAAFYSDGIRAVTGEPHTFGIVAAEKSPPFGVRAAPIDPDAIADGRVLYRRALRLISRCRCADRWPSYRDPEAWRLPHYKRVHPNITAGGVPVTFPEEA